MKKPYSLSRPATGRKCWRYKLDGMTAYRSTGKRTKREAEIWVQELLYGKRTMADESVTLREATEGMFVRGRCRWIKRKEQHGRPVTREMAQLRRGHLDNHILPFFGARLVSAIKKRHLDDWLIDLKLSAAVKNHVLDTLHIIWSELVDLDLVTEDVTLSLQRFKGESVTKGTLTPEAFVTLFPQKVDELARVWRDAKWAALFATMATTGIRLGEAFALTWADIKQTQSGAHYLDIHKAAKNDGRIGSTKNGKPRVVLMFDLACHALEAWRELSPRPADEDLIFPNRRGKPMQRGVALRHWHKVIEAYEIESPDGPLTPHSLRHTYNTMMRFKLEDHTLQQFTGHQSVAMTNHYDHTKTEALAEVLSAHMGTVTETWQSMYESTESEEIPA